MRDVACERWMGRTEGFSRGIPVLHRTQAAMFAITADAYVLFACLSAASLCAVVTNATISRQRWQRNVLIVGR